MPLSSTSLIDTPLHPDFNCLKMPLASSLKTEGYLFPQISQYEVRCGAQYAPNAASKLLFLYPRNVEVHDAQLLLLVFHHYPTFINNFGT